MTTETTLYRLELTATATALRGAALKWAAIAPEKRNAVADPLRGFLPETKRPTDLQLEAVYEITGKTEIQRLERGGNFTPATESAWCRAMLKRWAVQNSLTARGWFQHGQDREGVMLNG